ncbi:M48 family metallopeptidase [Pseudalkalibacillus hwajinpoensis]|uniref:M48 family metallopeptidase n=1 Tax=Guptibacillus hwajinpoensis TaxID=208199 RepID=UPI003850041E
MNKFRLLSIIPVIVMSMVKIELISIPVSENIVHYLFNGSFLLFAFVFLTPFVTMGRVKTFKSNTQHEIGELVKEVNFPESIDVYLAKSFFAKNAATYYGWGNPVILIGESIYQSCTREQVKFLIYHEYCHIKNKHIVINFLSFFMCLILLPITMLILSPYLIEISLFFAIALIFLSYMGGFLIHFYFARKRELQCDTYATAHVGESVSKETLQKLSKQNDQNVKLVWFSSHPKLEMRLKNVSS